MKKHILGFALFSLIVGTAVFVSAAFYKPVKKVEVRKDYVYEVSKRSCWKQPKQIKQVSPVSINITQAIFNPKTKKLDISFSTPYQQDVEVYAVNSKKGFVQRAMFNVNPDAENKYVQSMDLPAKWVNYLKPTDNMYVMIKTSLIDGNESNNFEAEAVPVLMLQEK